ncbi:response regulator transcription factor [uncultured Nocardioides sp.]|uniref:response regulator transcription factor n=1 Tax=uncultured Nocardioides sp. TaxID=198441 RepID=UPI0026053DD9|nr:response regulator transcription factor [uncultured Nocardioides sp.]
MPTVLIVEDEPDLAQVMELALGRAGFDVLAVDTGSEARAVIGSRQIDVVVMDRGLPDMDGLEATAFLRAAGFLGAVLVTSGHAGTDHVAASLGAGADDVLGKPFTLAELVERVRGSVRPATVAEAG